MTGKAGSEKILCALIASRVALPITNKNICHFMLNELLLFYKITKN